MPPLRVVWSLTAVGVLLLAAYVWLLITIKQRAAIYPDRRTSSRARAGRKPARPSAPAHQRYVAEGKRPGPSHGQRARHLGEGDRVHVVVRTREPARRRLAPPATA